MLIDIIVPVGIVAVAYIIRYLLKKPLVYDLYGKESKKMATHDEEMKYLNELIIDAKNLDMKEIKTIADAYEVKQIIQKTKDNGFYIKAIIAPGTSVDLAGMNLQKNNRVEIRESYSRPMKHFTIIGPHLLVESPHSITAKDRDVFGIKYPKCDYYDHFNNIFNMNWSKMDKETAICTNANTVIPSDDSSAGQYDFKYQLTSSYDH
jgi:hypothetical protein